MYIDVYSWFKLASKVLSFAQVVQRWRQPRLCERKVSKVHLLVVHVDVAMVVFLQHPPPPSPPQKKN